ncbi:MAG: DUF541 domain-containing protein [Candidatus Pacebacteria bacterium]|nr:DUF541 domain-containing protein [Candidatus Paceibacterota bacterium]
MDSQNKIFQYSRPVFWVLLDLVLIFGVLLGLSAVFSGNPLRERQTISVSGEGKAVLTPDLVLVSFSLISQGADPKNIQDDNSKKMNSVIDFVKSKAIDAKDIKTSNYNLSPRYESVRPDIYPYYGNNNKIVGYTLTQSVEIKIRDFAKISDVLAGLPKLGINEISGVNFQVENPDTYLKPAREEAFKKAKERALDMTRQAGVSLGKVVTFSDSSGNYMPIAYGRGGAMKLDSMEAAIAPNIEPGSENVSVYVSVTYEIR